MACLECGCEEQITEDGVTFCGLCGLIPEPTPEWSLTSQDIGHIYHPPSNGEPGYFEPTINEYGWLKYWEHMAYMNKKMDGGK